MQQHKKALTGLSSVRGAVAADLVAAPFGEDKRHYGANGEESLGSKGGKGVAKDIARYSVLFLGLVVCFTLAGYASAFLLTETNKVSSLAAVHHEISLPCIMLRAVTLFIVAASLEHLRQAGIIPLHKLWGWSPKAQPPVALRCTA